MRFVCLVLGIVPLLMGCAAKDAAKMTVLGSYEEPEILQASLFASDQAILSNEAIEKILTARVVLPAQARVAILRLGQSWRHGHWSEEVARLNQEAVDRLVSTLQACDRVRDASVLPSLLTPEKQAVPHLREAAARFQTDLLLIYCSASRTYQKQRFLSADEAKAYCQVEAVLLDVRTGIVPFTSAIAKTYVAQKASEDISFAETMRKAEAQALGQALDEIGQRLAKFIASAPST